MATPEEIQDRIDALELAIHQGVSTVTYDGRTVTYRSLDAMRRILRDLQSQLGTTTDDGRRCAVFSRGY